MLCMLLYKIIILLSYYYSTLNRLLVDFVAMSYAEIFAHQAKSSSLLGKDVVVYLSLHRTATGWYIFGGVELNTVCKA